MCQSRGAGNLGRKCILPLPLFGNCNIFNVSGHFVQRSISKDLDYVMIVFVILVIEVEAFQGELASQSSAKLVVRIYYCNPTWLSRYRTVFGRA
jgi:hypothetical protein